MQTAREEKKKREAEEHQARMTFLDIILLLRGRDFQCRLLGR
jgi:hypothetical protein